MGQRRLRMCCLPAGGGPIAPIRFLVPAGRSERIGPVKGVGCCYGSIGGEVDPPACAIHDGTACRRCRCLEAVERRQRARDSPSPPAT